MNLSVQTMAAAEKFGLFVTAYGSTAELMFVGLSQFQAQASERPLGEAGKRNDHRLGEGRGRVRVVPAN